MKKIKFTLIALVTLSSGLFAFQHDGLDHPIVWKQTGATNDIGVYTDIKEGMVRRSIVGKDSKELKRIYGDMDIIGATISVPTNGGYNYVPVTGALWKGTLTNIKGIDDANYRSQCTQWDRNNGKCTLDYFNSSYSTFDFSNKPTELERNHIDGSKVIYARLYWAGGLSNPWNDHPASNVAGLRNKYLNDISGFKHVRFGTPDGKIHRLIANPEDVYWWGAYAWYNTAYQGGMYFMYQASVDVTDLVKASLTKDRRTFSAGGIRTSSSLGDNNWMSMYRDGDFKSSRYYLPPHYGGWALLIVYDFGEGQRKKIKPKSVNIYDGLRVLDPSVRTNPGSVSRNLQLKFEGFYTPPSGSVNSTLAVMSFGGKYETGSEDIQVWHKNNNRYESVASGQNASGKQFNSTITKFGSNINSGKTYNNQMDLDVFDISGKIGNAQTDAWINLIAKSEWVSGILYSERANVGLVAFSTDVYIPEVCYVEKLLYSKNNGTTFTEVSTDPSAKTVIAKNNILRTQLQITNQGNEYAQFVSVSAMLDDESAKYKDNSTYVTPHSSSSSFTLGALQTDNDPAGLQTLLSGNKGINVNIGQGATPAKGGTIKKNENAYIQYDSTLNKKFKLASYETKFKNLLLNLEYDGVMNPCQGNKKYHLTIMEPGKYKVVNEKFAKKGDNENLFTQIAGKEFDVNVAFLSDSLNVGQTPAGPSEKQKVMLDVVTSCDSSGLSVLANSPKPTAELDETHGVVKIKQLLINNAYSKLFFNISVFNTGTNQWVSECGYSDAFAVRPEKFVAHQNNGTIVSTSETSPIRLVGGAPYTNTGMTAVYGSNIIATGYTQTLQTDTATNDDDKTQIVRFTPILSSTCEANVPNAVVTNLKKINANAIFSQGKGTLSNSGGTNFSYPDIGLAKVYLKDASYTAIDGAQNDCIKNSDTTTKNSDAKVGCDIRGEMFLSFAPQSIAVRNLQISNFGSGNMTYVSNDSAMSSNAAFNIQALLGNGNVAKLYTRSCYAQRTSFTMGIDRIIPDYTDNNGETTDTSTANPATLARNLASAIREVIFFDNDAGSDTRKIAGSAANIGSYSVNATAFADTDATARVNIRFNFARTTNLAKNPFTVSSNTFTFNNISSSNAGILASAPGAAYVKPTAVSNTTFYYGQVYAPTYTGPMSGFAGNIYYGIYCKGCNKAVYPLANTNATMPQAGDNWVVNAAHRNNNQGTHGAFTKAATTTVTVANPINNGVERINLSSTSVGTDIVLMNAPSWLIFDPSNAAATVNRFTVNFTSNDTNWGGQALAKNGTDVGAGNVVGTGGGRNGRLNNIMDKSSKRIEW